MKRMNIGMMLASVTLVAMTVMVVDVEARVSNSSGKAKTTRSTSKRTRSCEKKRKAGSKKSGPASTKTKGSTCSKSSCNKKGCTVTKSTSPTSAICREKVSDRASATKTSGCPVTGKFGTCKKTSCTPKLDPSKVQQEINMVIEEPNANGASTTQTITKTIVVLDEDAFPEQANVWRNALTKSVKKKTLTKELKDAPKSELQTRGIELEERKRVRLTRTVSTAVDLIFPRRHSSRHFSDEIVTTTELNTLFEAARWAPSCYNTQPWRFIYARKGKAMWDSFVNLLVPFNQEWASSASALVAIVSKKTMDDGTPNPTHSFDAGAAWMSMALQGSMRDLVVHGMAGFDYDAAASVLNLPDDYQVEAMVAVGKPRRVMRSGEKVEQLSDRKPLHEIACEGTFKF